MQLPLDTVHKSKHIRILVSASQPSWTFNCVLPMPSSISDPQKRLPRCMWWRWIFFCLKGPKTRWRWAPRSKDNWQCAGLLILCSTNVGCAKSRCWGRGRPPHEFHPRAPLPRHGRAGPKPWRGVQPPRAQHVQGPIILCAYVLVHLKGKNKLRNVALAAMRLNPNCFVLCETAPPVCSSSRPIFFLSQLIAPSPQGGGPQAMLMNGFSVRTLLCVRWTPVQHSYD